MDERPRDLDEIGQRRWGSVFAAVWLFYLASPLEAGWDRRETVAGWVGMAATVAFAAIYLLIFIRLRRRRAVGAPFRAYLAPWPGAGVVLVEVVLAVVMCVTIGQSGTTASVYIAVTAVMCLPTRWAWLVAVVDGFGAYLASILVPGWDEDSGILFGTLVAALAIWGISQAINRNIEVLAVREENAQLALEDERNRFARDLHDILGHSLTVITVKAELANRLFEVDADRARAELADLERLSRDALADVRRAVGGYRDLTLPGELARARSALSAAEIEAELPNSTDDVPSDRRELFAWAVREGITNVIRHSRASRCQVRLSADRVEIIDDGCGSAGGTPGHGLVGLRERAAKLGGTVLTESRDSGFALTVVVR
ncbi:sensor histidine kinase [Nocardioides terrisoli]|uniref:sensor histidine kinase n=1 Tax=Nocardioides terrisoli TaxID=3388267 RepID=UPI00287B8EA1|nr:sensor histidine kinase [Nocardioides marmorisolisilvae]